MANILVVDGSVVMYQQYAKLGHLSTAAGEPTGLRFGFIRAIRSYREKLKCDKVVVAWDSPGPVKKATDSGFENYKTNRVWTDEKGKMYNQLPALKEMISLTGWSQVEEVGYEADDLIATVTRKLNTQGHFVFIVTKDNDLCQLINPQASVFTPGKDSILKDELWVLQNFRVPPRYLLYYRAAVGDVSDNIPGVGLGTNETSKFASRLLLLPQGQYGDSERYARECFDELAKNYGPSVRERWEQNLTLMRLIQPEAVQLTKGKADQNALRELFLKLEFRSLMAKIPEFCS